MTWRAEDPQGNEAAKCRFDIVPYTRGTVLDLGCGPHKAFRHFLGVDNCKDTELFGIQMRPEITCDLADPQAFRDTFKPGSVDAVFSSHLLEHIVDYRGALAAWWEAIKVGGHLVLYLPHRDLYPNVGQPGANPDHKHDFVPNDILGAMVDGADGGTGFEMVECERRDGGFEYSFLLVLRKRDDGERIIPPAKPNLGKTVCVVRYGGFGDMIQAASILPELKRQGYHVTVMTTPKGKDILAHDPHVDAFFLQDNDQVDNHELTPYWACWAKKFDRFINLSESVEGSLLAYPGRVAHGWPHKLRHRMLDQNYLQFTAEIADVPYDPTGSGAKFWPTREEADAAQRFIGRLRTAGKPAAGPVNAPPVLTIMLVLAGSSVHKMWPHMDDMMASVLALVPEARFILVGDELCQLLEQGWEDNPRVSCTSGKLAIRQTLALAQACEIVVGPETGVLNAVAFEPDVRKIVMLSHSSFENLSRDWVNTDTMVPGRTPCYPCHQLHVGRAHCPEYRKGAAQCAYDIEPDMVTDAVLAHAKRWRLAHSIAEAVPA